MVVSTLAVSYQDTRAAALGWSLDVAEQPAVATLDVAVRPAAGIVLHLRVLGASHQIVLRAADGAPLVTETVACLPRPLPPLPDAAEVTLGRLRYELRSEVVRRPEASFAADVEDLLVRYGPDPAALIGRFPGDRHAVTVLWADPAIAPGTLARWRTWHAYPRHHQIVRTTSMIRTRERGGDPCPA